MLQIARTAKNAVEQVPGVLSAELRGSRDEAVEIIVDPMLMKSYSVSLDQLIVGFNASNSLIAAGALEGSTGRFAVKVPSLIERPQDVLKIPMAASNGAAVTVGDVVHDPADLQGRDLGDARQRHAGDDHRSVEAHRRQPDRDRRRREEGDRDACSRRGPRAFR